MAQSYASYLAGGGDPSQYGYNAGLPAGGAQFPIGGTSSQPSAGTTLMGGSNFGNPNATPAWNNSTLQVDTGNSNPYDPAAGTGASAPAASTPSAAASPSGTSTPPAPPVTSSMGPNGVSQVSYANYKAPPAPGAAAPAQYFPNSTIPTANPFGGTPFMANPTGTGPNGSYPLNSTYFPTQDTANQFAKTFGGTVVPQDNIINAPGSPFTQNQQNYMVRMPDGHLVNPGVIAGYYASGNNNAQGLIQAELSGQGAGNVGYNPALGPGVLRDGPGSPTANPAQNPALAALLPQNNASQQALSAFDFGPLVTQLYGSNPFQAASGGNTGFAALLSMLGGAGQNSATGAGTGTDTSGTGNNMANIATILNALFSQRTGVSNGALSPLFWGSGQQVPSSQYYPPFY